MRRQIPKPLIDWQQCAINLRRVKPLAQIARELEIDPATLQRIARGETVEPKFEQGLQLLNLHLQHCPDRHQALLKT